MGRCFGTPLSENEGAVASRRKKAKRYGINATPTFVKARTQSVDTYSVDFPPGPIGLQLHSTDSGVVRVQKFVDGGPNIPGAARQSGKVSLGDTVTLIDGHPVGSYQEAVAELKMKVNASRTVTFSRWHARSATPGSRIWCRERTDLTLPSPATLYQPTEFRSSRTDHIETKPCHLNGLADDNALLQHSGSEKGKESCPMGTLVAHDVHEAVDSDEIISFEGDDETLRTELECARHLNDVRHILSPDDSEINDIQWHQSATESIEATQVLSHDRFPSRTHSTASLPPVATSPQYRYRELQPVSDVTFQTLRLKDHTITELKTEVSRMITQNEAQVIAKSALAEELEKATKFFDHEKRSLGQLLMNEKEKRLDLERELSRTKAIEYEERSLLEASVSEAQTRISDLLRANAQLVEERDDLLLHKTKQFAELERTRKYTEDLTLQLDQQAISSSEETGHLQREIGHLEGEVDHLKSQLTQCEGEESFLASRKGYQEELKDFRNKLKMAEKALSTQEVLQLQKCMAELEEELASKVDIMDTTLTTKTNLESTVARLREDNATLSREHESALNKLTSELEVSNYQVSRLQIALDEAQEARNELCAENTKLVCSMEQIDRQLRQSLSKQIRLRSRLSELQAKAAPLVVRNIGVDSLQADSEWEAVDDMYFSPPDRSTIAELRILHLEDTINQQRAQSKQLCDTLDELALRYDILQDEKSQIELQSGVCLSWFKPSSLFELCSDSKCQSPSAFPTHQVLIEESRNRTGIIKRRDERIEKLLEDLRQTSQTIDSLVVANGHLTGQLNENRNERRKLVNELKTSKAMVEESKAELSGAMNQIGSLRQVLADQKVQLSFERDRAKEIEPLRNEVVSLTKEQASSREYNTRISCFLNQLRTDLSIDSQDDDEVIRARVITSLQELHSTKGKLEDAVFCNKGIKTRNADLSRSLKDGSRKFAESQRALERSQEELKTVREEFAVMKADLEAQVLHVTKSHQELHSSFLELKDGNASQASKLVLYEGKLRASEAEKASLQQSLLDLRRVASTKDERVHDIQVAYQSLVIRQEALVTDYERATSTLEETYTKEKNLEAEVRALNATIDDLHIEIDRHKASLQMSRASVVSLQTKRRLLEEQCEDVADDHTKQINAAANQTTDVESLTKLRSSKEISHIDVGFAVDVLGEMNGFVTEIGVLVSPTGSSQLIDAMCLAGSLFRMTESDFRFRLERCQRIVATARTFLDLQKKQLSVVPPHHFQGAGAAQLSNVKISEPFGTQHHDITSLEKQIDALLQDLNDANELIRIKEEMFADLKELVQFHESEKMSLVSKLQSIEREQVSNNDGAKLKQTQRKAASYIFGDVLCRSNSYDDIDTAICFRTWAFHSQQDKASATMRLSLATTLDKLVLLKNHLKKSRRGKLPCLDQILEDQESV